LGFGLCFENVLSSRLFFVGSGVDKVSKVMAKLWEGLGEWTSFDEHA
jgi:hypothetical protein